jgi:hypothetical protein
MGLRAMDRRDLLNAATPRKFRVVLSPERNTLRWGKLTASLARSVPPPQSASHHYEWPKNDDPISISGTAHEDSVGNRALVSSV